MFNFRLFSVFNCHKSSTLTQNMLWGNLLSPSVWVFNYRWVKHMQAWLIQSSSSMDSLPNICGWWNPQLWVDLIQRILVNFLLLVDTMLTFPYRFIYVHLMKYDKLSTKHQHSGMAGLITSWPVRTSCRNSHQSNQVRNHDVFPKSGCFWHETNLRSNSPFFQVRLKVRTKYVKKILKRWSMNSFFLRYPGDYRVLSVSSVAITEQPRRRNKPWKMSQLPGMRPCAGSSLWRRTCYWLVNSCTICWSWNKCVNRQVHW